MELNNLRPAEGSTKTRKRIGRGTGSGRGGTSTRGHKGDRSRSGSREKRAFEGGQTPMQRRLPKRGFQNINRVEFVPLNIGQLESLSKRAGSATLSHDILVSLGVAKATERIKILGKGKLTTKVEVTAHACSASARAAIEAAGGTIHTV
jgi:large subunit ribosomal protein L15